MPRSGINGTATPPPGTIPKNPNDIIPSAAWNALFQDLYQIANTPVPTSYGGTGGGTPEEARENLGVPSLKSTTGHIYGLRTSNNVVDAVNDIDVAPGNAASDDPDPTLLVLAASITKRLDAAWMAGSGNGGLDTGAVANGTYHVWLIRRPDNGTVDVLFSLSPTAPTMPADYTQKRRIGRIMRISGSIKGFVQTGDRFEWKSPVQDIVASNPGTGSVLRTLSVPSGDGIVALVSYLYAVYQNTNIAIYLSNPALDDVAASNSGAFTGASYWQIPGQVVITSGVAEVVTNASSQIRSRINFSDASTDVRITTRGWIDTRGRE